MIYFRTGIIFRTGCAMNIMYSIRPLDKDSNVVTEPIFETFNLVEALRKLEECTQLPDDKYIIVSYCIDNIQELETNEIMKLNK